MITLDGKTYYTQSELDEAVNRQKQITDFTTKCFADAINSLLPDRDRMYHGKKNTTVKFRDGNSITVKRMKGDKDSLETAFAYIVAFKALGKSQFKSFIKSFKEVK